MIWSLKLMMTTKGPLAESSGSQENSPGRKANASEQNRRLVRALSSAKLRYIA